MDFDTALAQSRLAAAGWAKGVSWPDVEAQSRSPEDSIIVLCGEEQKHGFQ
jgi:hypothetical protein